jgi:predicted RNA-binding Zn-ribbon protein involved in translation (DUF1610 family)
LDVFPVLSSGHFVQLTTSREVAMKQDNPKDPVRWEEEVWPSHPLMERSGIRRDTYLNCWCPSCGASLNQNGKAVFHIVNRTGEEGISRVSPYLNILDRESTIQVDDDEELIDVRCIHCGVSLIEPGRLCRQDQCKMVRVHFSVQDSGRLSLIFCVRRTCRWYTMSEEDNERLIIGESHEW